MRLAATGVTVTGPAHLQDGTPNQDAMGVYGIRKGWCIAVCDGLGSRCLSHIGAKKAVALVRQQIQQDCKLPAKATGLAIREAWLRHFADSYHDYETTCLWAHVDAWGRGRVAQTGDGLALLKSRGGFQVISRPRQGFGNLTTTLAQANASQWEAFDFELKLPGDGVVLMTDGISDDLIPEQLEPFFDTIYHMLVRTNKRRMRSLLTSELLDWSTPRHGDDKSITCIFRTD